MSGERRPLPRRCGQMAMCCSMPTLLLDSSPQLSHLRNTFIDLFSCALSFPQPTPITVIFSVCSLSSLAQKGLSKNTISLRVFALLRSCRNLSDVLPSSERRCASSEAMGIKVEQSGQATCFGGCWEPLNISYLSTEASNADSSH